MIWVLGSANWGFWLFLSFFVVDLGERQWWPLHRRTAARLDVMVVARGCLEIEEDVNLVLMLNKGLFAGVVLSFLLLCFLE